MTTTGIKHGRVEYTITCAQCRKEQTILTRDLRTAASRFRALGWSTKTRNVCPTCRAKLQKLTRPPSDETERIKAEQKKRHDEMFGLTGEWEA